MRRSLILLTVIALSCNSNKQPAKQTEQASLDSKCFTYPKSVDRLQVRDLYDSARWYVYVWHCDEAYLPKSDTSRSVTFGELPLKFNNLGIKGDTIEIYFDFIDESEPHPILPSMTRDNNEFLSGVAFNIKTRKKVYMLSPNGFSAVDRGPTTRYEKPLQPEVLAYIKKTWDNLDICFKELVKQKGIKQ